MKKVLSIIMAMLLAFSVVTCAAFAETEEADKGIAFLKQTITDRGAKISIDKIDIASGISISDIDAAVKINKDSVDLSGSGQLTLPILGTKSAKIYVSGEKMVASFSIFKVDVTSILKKLGQDPEDIVESVTEVTGPINDILDKLDPQYLDYLECKKVNSKGSRFYGINYQALADKINEIAGETVVESPATIVSIAEAIGELAENEQMVAAFAEEGIDLEYIAELIEADSKLTAEILKSSDITDYILKMDYDGDTLTGISVIVPDTNKPIGTDSLNGVKIKAIENLGDDSFKEPGGINITGLVNFFLGLFA